MATTLLVGQLELHCSEIILPCACFTIVIYIVDTSLDSDCNHQLVLTPINTHVHDVMYYIPTRASAWWLKLAMATNRNTKLLIVPLCRWISVTGILCQWLQWCRQNLCAPSQTVQALHCIKQFSIQPHPTYFFTLKICRVGLYTLFFAVCYPYIRLHF